MTMLISTVSVFSHLNSSVPLHDVQHPILGVKFLVLGFEIVVNEIITSSERIRVGFPLRLAGNLDHVSRPVRFNIVTLKKINP